MDAVGPTLQLDWPEIYLGYLFTASISTVSYGIEGNAMLSLRARQPSECRSYPHRHANRSIPRAYAPRVVLLKVYEWFYGEGSCARTR